MNQPHRRRVKRHGQVLQLRTRRRRALLGLLFGPLAPGEAALVSLVVIAVLLALNGLVGHRDLVDTLSIAALAGTVLRLVAWLKIGGGRR